MISGKLILTVGDDETLRQILVEQLQLNGEFRIKEARTGKEALQYTEKHTPTRAPPWNILQYTPGPE